MRGPSRSASPCPTKFDELALFLRAEAPGPASAHNAPTTSSIASNTLPTSSSVTT